jgi:glycosyltransferase involved in cell wall biosynthesis
MRQGRKCILFVAPVPPPVHGGALAMQYLLEELRDTDLHVLHVDSKFAGSLDDIGSFSLSKLLRLPRYCWRMLCHTLRGGVDLAVLTPTFYVRPFLKDAVFIWWSTLVLRRRTAAWFHMDYRAMGYGKLGRLTQWFVRTTLRRCRHFVIASARLRQFLPDWMPADRIVALPNGIPAPVPMRSRKDDGRVRVLYLSNLEEDKGWRVLLDAARTLCRELANVEFIFHGRPAFGLTEEEIRHRIAADDCDGRIRYLGPVFDDAKWQALADADVFAFPSFHEAFPLAVLEAMAAGLPVVATDVGGVPDAVTPREGGFIVPPRDAAALQSALSKLVSDPALRSRMGAWNRARYERDYTVSAYGRRWTEWLRGG